MTDVSQGSQAQTADVMKLFTMSLGLAYFTCLVSYDLWTSLKSRPHTRWIPAKALILTAFSIQVLTYLDYKNISISDKPDNKEYAELLAGQSVIDSGRLVICVFIGYMLPAMASPDAAADWSDIAALAMSLFTAIMSELYYIYKVNQNPGMDIDFPKYELWFWVSGLIVLVCTVMLILFLVAAILAGETVRSIFTERIRRLFEDKVSTNCLCKDNVSRNSFFKNKVMTSWVLCRVGHPQYVIARSILSSSTGLVVTVCIVFLVVKGRVLNCTDIIHRDDNWDWLRHTTFWLQCTFVLLGWVVILLRWLSAVFYFRIFSWETFSWGSVCQRCSVEDYWTRNICDHIHMYDIHQWRFAQLVHDHHTFKTIIAWFEAKFKFVLYFLLVLQTFLVFFSKCCWFISEIILLGFMFIHKCLRPSNKLSLYSSDKETLELLCMPGEDPQSIWLANEKAFRQAQERLTERQNTSNKLKEFLANHIHRLEGEKFVDQLEHVQPIVKYFPALGKNCWKITAVSLLKIIAKLSSPKTKECIEAYKQAWELMTFPDEVVDDPISVSADKEFRKEFKRLKPRETPTTIANLLQEAKEELQAQKIPMQENDNVHVALVDSKDWNVIAPSYNMYIVCDHIIKSADINGSTVVDLLKDVICDCLKKFLEALETKCSEWAVDFEEEKIWEAISLAGKAKTVLPECCNSVEAQV